MLIDRLRRSLPFVFYGVVAAWYSAPLFDSPDGLGILDWDQHLFYYGSVIKSLFEYHQLPFWNPWYCGGNVLWQNPQVPLLTPVIPLVAVMSLPLAMKVNIALHYWVGLVGFHLLLHRSLGVRSRSVVAGLSAVGVLSGAMAMHLTVGHSVFLPVLYLPLQLHFVIQGIRTRAVRPFMWAAIPLALMIWNGALHAVPISLAAVGFVSLGAAVAQRRVMPLVAAALVATLGFAYSAPKLLPISLFVTSDQFFDARPAIEHPDAMSAEMVTRAYLDRYQYRNLRFAGQRSGWYEYGNYIGGFAAIVIAGAMILAFAVPRTDERWLGFALATATLLFLLMSAGEFSAWAPASLARLVPLFSSFRIPSRYTFGVVVMGIATAGWAWRALSGEAPLPAPVRLMAGALCLLAALDVGAQTREHFVGVFNGDAFPRSLFPRRAGPDTPPTTDASGNPYGPGSPMLHSLVKDTDFWGCYEPLLLQRTANPSLPYLAGDGGARISDVHFSPNRIDFSLIAGRDTTRLALNQNGAPGWSSSAGAVTPLQDAGMAIAVTPGQAGRYVLRFTPPGLWAGVAILLAAVAASIAGRGRQLPDR
ncbi:MAG: hypothetical protein U0Q55_03185 [Vicinamibacterales bacterium]